jgi:hypothetical protein
MINNQNLSRIVIATGVCKKNPERSTDYYPHADRSFSAFGTLPGPLASRYDSYVAARHISGNSETSLPFIPLDTRG